MIKKISWLFIILFITGCSAFPISFPAINTPKGIAADESSCFVCPTCPPSVVTSLPPTVTKTPAPKATTTPTMTPVPTKTPTPTKTATFTPQPTPVPYAIQTGSPVYLKNFAYLDKACNWSGVAGQVFDTSGKPLSNIVVVVKGVYGTTTINKVGLTGMTAGKYYGDAAFEIVLGGSAIATTNKLTIQLMDLNGNALSTAVPFSTSSDCLKNLVIINFVRK